MNMPILSVRLKMPEPRKNYILRPSLFERLDTIFDYKVTVIKAGAGCGKTTLFSSYVRERSIKEVAWITLDENANQVFLFWNYVIEALKEYLGEDRLQFQNLYEANIQKENLWQILSLFMNKLSTLQDIILVLDDFQVITDPFLISTIDYMVTNMGDNLHLVLLTREMPGIYLGSLAMENKVLFLDENDIKLTREESRNFLRNTLMLGRDEQQLDAMIEASNGWIGGLQLLAAASKNVSTQMQNLRCSNRMMEDYISKEIFCYLSAVEQEFLIKTAILRYFNREICQRYLPMEDFHTMIESILGKNLFIMSINDHLKVYRYHAILSEYLQERFEKLGEEKYELHQLAAKIYFDIGDEEEGLHHLFKIKDYKSIMSRLLTMSQTVLTFSYMMKVPLEEIKYNTDFAYQYFFCHYASINLEECERIYQYITDNMQEDSTFAAFMHSDLFFGTNWQFHKIRVLSLEQIDSLRLNPVTIAYLLIKEAFFLYATERNKEALQYLQRAETVYKKTGNVFIGFFVLAEKAQILEDLGEFNECFALYKEMEPIQEKVKSLASSYYIGISGLYIRRLELKKALNSLEKAKSCIKKEALNIYYAYQYTYAEYCYILGNYEETIQIIKELSGQDSMKNIMYSARLLRYPIYRGNHNDLAIKFAKDYDAEQEYNRVMETDLLYAGIKFENGEKDVAITTVTNLITKARKTQNKLKIVEGDLLKARFLLGEDKNKREITNLFVEAVSYAHSELIALPFWFEKTTVDKIMTQIKEDIVTKLSKDELNFIANIRMLGTNHGLEALHKEKMDLTEREKEVFNELSKGYTNKEIAEHLCVSLATVKSHVINIYSKLGVNNRIAAIHKIKGFSRE